MNATLDLEEVTELRKLLVAKQRPEGWAARRTRIDEVCSTWPVSADVVLTPADADGVPCEWSLAPGSDAARVLLYFHGGGYCSGSLESHRRLVTEAGRAAGVRTLAVDYRLAPEHPFPAAPDDAHTVWRWLLGQGYASRDIVMGGDSAGGGLTLNLLFRLRAAGSPLFGDLSGLPPMLIQVGSAEALLDDAVRLAVAAGAADVPVTLEIWPHMIHAWPAWNGGLDAGRRALTRAGLAMRRRL